MHRKLDVIKQGRKGCFNLDGYFTDAGTLPHPDAHRRAMVELQRRTALSWH